MDDDAASLAFAKASTPVKAQDNTKATALAQTEAPKEVAVSARGRLVLATSFPVYIRKEDVFLSFLPLHLTVSLTHP